MAEIVVGVASSHVPSLFTRREFEPGEKEMRDRAVAGLEDARRLLENARPDVIVIFSTDHFDRCFYDNLPPFLVGVGEQAEGPINEWLHMPKVKVKVDGALGRWIVTEGLQNDIDFAFSQELPLDHAEVVPLSFLTPRWDVPIVPVVVNAFAPPMPTLKRCAHVGAFVRSAIERWPEKKRVAVIGTGGLSHWVGPPETGRVNAEFDRWFMQCLVEGKSAAVIEQYKDYRELEKVAGNGGQEIRDWLAVAGAMPPGLKPRVLAYEPIRQWVTGTGVMAWA